MNESLVNNILSNSVKGQPDPVIGMGVTLLSYSDRHPATIINVFKDGTLIAVQSDNYTRIDNNGMSESQEYTYSPNSNAAVYYFKKDKNGRWNDVYFNPKTNRWKKINGYKLMLGRREKYHDFSF